MVGQGLHLQSLDDQTLALQRQAQFTDPVAKQVACRVLLGEQFGPNQTVLHLQLDADDAQFGGRQPQGNGSATRGGGGVEPLGHPGDVVWRRAGGRMGRANNLAWADHFCRRPRNCCVGGRLGGKRTAGHGDSESRTFPGGGRLGRGKRVYRARYRRLGRFIRALVGRGQAAGQHGGTLIAAREATASQQLRHRRRLKRPSQLGGGHWAMDVCCFF